MAFTANDTHETPGNVFSIFLIAGNYYPLLESCRGSSLKRFSSASARWLFKADCKASLYADRSDRRKSPGVPGAGIAIFADRRDRRIKSPISGISNQYRRINSPSVPVSAIF